MGFLTQWFTAPAVPPLKIPVPIRYIPGVRQVFETVCKGFFYIGLKCGFDAGYVVGFLSCAFIVACWWSFTSYLRNKNKILRRSLRRPGHQQRCECRACTRALPYYREDHRP